MTCFLEARIDRGLVSSSAFYQARATTAAPNSGCVFVQLWRGAELLGLAKVTLKEKL